MSALDTAEYRRLALLAAGVDPSQIPAILDTATWRRLMIAALVAISEGGGGGGAGYVNGSVQFYADLPVTVGTPPVNTAYLVREDSGVWFINRKPAGIYVRLFNNGTLADWDYAGEFPSVNDSQYFRIYDTVDPTKELAFDVSGISSGTTRTLDAPNRDGRIAVSDYRLLSANANAVTGDKVAADTTSAAWTLTLPATPSNGDTVTVLDYAGTFDTNNLTIARNGSNIESLAEDMTCNVEDAAFTLVFVGSTVGWKVVPYFGNKTNFASPDPIGSSVPNTGRFTTLTANNGTITASAPVLDLAQTWNASGTTFTGLNLALTNTASASASAYLSFALDGSQAFSIRRGESTTPATIITCGGSGLTWTARTRTGAGVGVNFSGIVGIGTNIQFGTGSSTTGGDVVLTRDDAANTLALRNAANAQTFNIYNTFTSATNHERLRLAWASNVAILGTEKGSGGGTARNLEIQTDGITRISWSGAVGNTAIGAGLALIFNERVRLIPSGGDGILRLTNIGDSGFDRLQFGGTTSSFPALKRSSAILQARLADDSGYTTMDAQLRAQGTAPATTGATGTAGDIRYDADYIYVCTATNTWKRAAIATW